MTAEPIGLFMLLLALSNGIIVWGSFRKEYYHKVLLVLGMGSMITGMGLMILADKIEEQVTSISDPKLQDTIYIALIGISFVVLGANNLAIGFMNLIKNLRRA